MKYFILIFSLLILSSCSNKSVSVTMESSTSILLTKSVVITPRTFKSDSIQFGEAITGGVIDSIYFVNFDKKGNPITIKRDREITLLVWDDNRNLVEKSFYSKDGAAIVDSKNVHSYVYSFDKENRLTSVKEIGTSTPIIGAIVSPKVLNFKKWVYEGNRAKYFFYTGEEKLDGAIFYALTKGEYDNYYTHMGEVDPVFEVTNSALKVDEQTDVVTSKIIIDSVRYTSLYNFDIPKIVTLTIDSSFPNDPLMVSRVVERKYLRSNIAEINVFKLNGARMSDENGISRYTFDENGKIKYQYDTLLNKMKINSVVREVAADSFRYDSFTKTYSPVNLAKNSKRYRFKLNSYGDAIEVKGYFFNKNLIQKFKFDTNHYPTRLQYFTFDNTPASDNRGVHGFDISVTNGGLSQSFITFDTAFVYSADREGVAKIKIDRDTLGRIVSTEYYRSNNTILYGVATKWGDAKLPPKEITTYGPNGLDVLQNRDYFKDFQNPGINFAIAGVQLDYNERGDTSFIATIGVDGQPVNSNRGYAVKTFKRNGLVETTSYFDNRYNLVKIAAGYAKIEIERDENGNITKKSTFGADDKLIEDRSGVAVYVTQYENDKTVEESYFNRYNRLTENRDGVAKYVREFDDKGFLTSLSFYNRNNHLTSDKNGIAIYKTIYDGHPNKLISRTTYNANNQPIADKDGVVTYRYTYDKLIRRTSESYLDRRGKLMHISGGYSSIEYVYLPGKPKVTRYLNRFGKVVKEK